MSIQDKAQAVIAIVNIDGVNWQLHHFSRFIGEKTELWFFGVGCADEAIMNQMGNAFLTYVANNDPCLGRIGISLGMTPTAFFPLKLDFNLWWAWGQDPDWFNTYMMNVRVKPTLILCLSDLVKKEAEKNGFDTLSLPFGVWRFFKPLGLERKGIGYAGNLERSSEQFEMLLSPFRNRGDFELCRKNKTDPYISYPELNEWYNRKQLLLGTMAEGIAKLDIPINSVLEILASGTPLITSCSAINNVLNFDYPYVTDSKEKTVVLADEIFQNYPETLTKFGDISQNILKNHNYLVRLKTLFDKLETLKCG